MNKEFANQQARGEIETRIEQIRSLYKFRFFFTGLVFAILSFAIQFSVDETYLWIKIIEVTSWFLLAVAGLISLRNIGGFSLNEPDFYSNYFTYISLSKQLKIIMWFSFVLGVFLLLVAKTSNSIMKAMIKFFS